MPRDHFGRGSAIKGGGKRSRRGRGFTPARAQPVLASLGDVGATTWGDGSVDHIAVIRPLCGHDGGTCPKPSMLWIRCRACRRVFGRCADHTAASGADVYRARDEHQCRAPDAEVIDFAAARAAREAR